MSDYIYILGLPVVYKLSAYTFRGRSVKMRMSYKGPKIEGIFLSNKICTSMCPFYFNSHSANQSNVR